MNRVRVRRRRLRDLLRIDSHADFHDYLFRHALERYHASLPQADPGLGEILAIGANHREARALAKLPFARILLTGITDPDDAIRDVARSDPRVSYRIENSESLSLDSRSFDLVLCKESLHHLARPALGLYEMLRVCRRAALWIEPYDTLAGRLFEAIGLATVYETQQAGNLGGRDNFVHRFARRPLELLLNSYYLESDYALEIHLGWMSSRFNAHPAKPVRRAAALAGWALGFVPGSRGNYMTALIVPGRDLPPDPIVAEAKPGDEP
ncbi:MAG: class I SAM-dependent methyltransferase [Myxococcales bacterium]|nr:class I SAM-dependent methyltransferase [Myxococcales bacterium]